MKRWSILLGLVMALTLLASCGPAAPEPTTSPPSIAPTSTLPTSLEASSKARLTPNPVEESKPIYGGILSYGYYWVRSFDAHQRVGWGPQVTLPIFNQLVMFDLNYKETVPETIIGDLAESWVTSPDGTEITFKLRQGVKWHDGVPFTADDVIYSLDKMVDVNRSAISGWFPAYQNAEKIDAYTVKVHLKYPSAGFMLALAQGESEILAYHLNAVSDQSPDFMVGTGPFILDSYVSQVNIKYKRNPNYWKKDKYGNQLPYLDGLAYYIADAKAANNMLVARRLDFKGPVTGASDLSTYNLLKDGAPELLWQRRDRYNGYPIFLNMTKKPLDDIRVRRAIGLVLNEDDVIIGATGDVIFGLPGTGILHPAYGLPKEEVAELMGWDKPYEERVAKAQQLMAEAGYPDGFKLSMMTGGGNFASACLVLGNALKKYLKIDTEILSLSGVELQKRLDENNYNTYIYSLQVTEDVSQLATYFSTTGYSNWSKYSNPEIDKMLADLDHILDPAKRQETIWAIERILLTDLPALPTGYFPPNMMPYYPYVKNLRWNYNSYSNISRLEDVWIDESLRVK